MKSSHVYAQKRWEVVLHLQPRLMAERKVVEAEYKVCMNKVMLEISGTVGERIVRRPDGREVTVRVVNFPDGSFARAPRDRDLESDKEFTIK